MSTEKATIPKNLGFESLNRILIGFLKAGAGKQGVHYKEAATRSGVHEDSVSMNNKFFVSTGFLVKEDSGTFRLTEDGCAYAQALDWGKLDEARKPLTKVVKNSEFFKTIIDSVSIAKKMTRDDLVARIASILGMPRESPNVVGINAVVDLILFSGLLREEDGSIFVGETEEPREAHVVVGPIPVTLGEIRVNEPARSALPIPININITIDENVDIAKLKLIVKTIRDALLEQ